MPHDPSPPAIGDLVLAVKLRRMVRNLRDAGWPPHALTAYARAEVAIHNRKAGAGVTIEQLNRFLTEHDLPVLSGAAAAVVA